MPTTVYNLVMNTFRNFIRNHDFNFSLREDEAAPSMGGSGGAPPNPDSSTGDSDGPSSYENVPNSMAREFNTTEEDMLAAIESGSLTISEIPDHEAEWGFTVRPPVDVTVTQINDDMYDVKFPFEMLHAMNPQIFVDRTTMPGNLVQYQGPVEDKTIQMTKGELMKAWQMSLAQSAGGGMPPMGGAPPMGGMDGGMDGGMGAPPMGGM